MIKLIFGMEKNTYKKYLALAKELGDNDILRLCNIALVLLSWVVQEVKSGRTIVSLDEKTMGYRELCMTFISTLRQKESERKTAVTKELDTILKTLDVKTDEG